MLDKDYDPLSISNSPAWLSSFIGREKEKARVTALLAQARLLTLTGPGGCGKTRLALETAREVSGQYSGGAWLVELGDVTEEEQVAQAAAIVFGLADSSAQPTLNRVIDYLKNKQVLLVLDNCEHLIEACARFARVLLAGCPDLRILATSREPLHISGEFSWPVPPLTLPDWQTGQPVDGLQESEAVRLFVERARAARADFEIDEQNAPAILHICRQVEGIPLAIELAAARVNLLSAGEIVRQMTSTFHWLENSNRLAPLRQQTLSSTVEWSHNLLSEEEQRLFRRLAVFTGGFSLEAAEAVGTANNAESNDGQNPGQVVALLARLVDKSFVMRSEIGGDESRYRLLEIVRQYGLQKLARSGEETAVREHHFAWCLAFAEKSNDEIYYFSRGIWINRMERELPNLRQALRWGISSSPSLEQVHVLSHQLNQFWQLRGYMQEGLKWVEELLDHREGVSSYILAQTLDMGNFLAQHLLNFDLAEQYVNEAIDLWRVDGNQEKTAWGISMLGWIAERKGEYTRAQKLADESMAIYEAVNCENFNKAGTLLLMCDLAYFRGDYNAAEQYLTQSMDICQQIGNQLGYTRRQARLAQILIEKGRLSRARSLLKQSLDANRWSEDRWYMAMILVAVVHLNVAQGRLVNGARCLGAVQVFLEWFDTHLWPVDRILFEKDLEFVNNRLSPPVFQAHLAEGRSQKPDVDQAAAYALLMLEEPAPQVSDPAVRQVKNRLTPREREIAMLISQGKNNTEIAQTLYLGVRTVEAHVTHILTKLDFSSRTQIAVWAVQKGLQ